MLKNLFLVCVFIILTSFGYASDVTYQLSTHILDVSKGVGAQGVSVQLFKQINNKGEWKLLDTQVTDNNGRIKNFLPKDKDNKGIYKIVFLVSPYFNDNTFYPQVDVVIKITDDSHYHAPITLSNFGYSTYRGN